MKFTTEVAKVNYTATANEIPKVLKEGLLILNKQANDPHIISILDAASAYPYGLEY